MAHFEIVRCDTGEVLVGLRVTSAADFHAQLFNWSDADIASAIFRVKGVEVSILEAIAAAKSVMDAAWNKKLATHKRVSYHDGVCGSLASNTRRTIWVRR